jgi:hypothetical protein
VPVSGSRSRGTGDRSTSVGTRTVRQEKLTDGTSGRAHNRIVRSEREVSMNVANSSAQSRARFMIPSGGEGHDGGERTVMDMPEDSGPSAVAAPSS